MKSRFVIYLPTDTREATAVSLASVAGVPLFLRSILALNVGGEKAFTIIAPANQRRHILKTWQKATRGRDIHLNLILTKHGYKISEDEYAELRGCSEETVYILNANYILPATSKQITTAISENRPPRAGEVQLLRPLTKRLAIIGLHITSLDTVMSGVKENPISAEEAITFATNRFNHHFITGEDEGLILEKYSDIQIAEHILVEHIRKNTATWVAREINKRISLPISLFLTRLHTSPNTITVINMFIGLCAGIGAAGRTYTGVLLGAILFQTASVIDGCDGEVAKLTFKTSKFGQYIDSISDNLSLAAFLTGIMIHQYRTTHSMHAFIWGGALIAGVLFLLAIMADYLRKYTNSASFVTFDKEFLQKLEPSTTPKPAYLLVKYFKIFFKKDLFSLMFLGFAVIGILHWWFYFVTLAIWVGVIVLLYLRAIRERVLIR